MVVGVCSFANTAGDCTSSPGGFARLTPRVLQWIQKVKVKPVKSSSHELCHFSNCKVDLWQHEMDLSIMMNSKNILEHGNEMIALKDNISESVEKEMALLKTEFSKSFDKINQVLTDAKKEILSLKNENEDMKIANKRMNDEIISLKSDWKVCVK